MALDEPTYSHLAEETLKRLGERIDDALQDHLEAEYSAGVLTITLEKGGVFVANKQAPNRQIWLASPLSGAWHFEYREGPGLASRWVATRGGSDTLAAVLSRELSQATGVALALD
jgi:frataxin